MKALKELERVEMFNRTQPGDFDLDEHASKLMERDR